MTTLDTLLTSMVAMAAAPCTTLRAFYVDDCTIYAAFDAEQAAVLFEQDYGDACEESEFPRELSSTELDRQVQEIDENERPTGRPTCARTWLSETTGPGFLAGSI